MKCPKCGSECWRDEHPDGYIAGVWNCPKCDFYESKQDVEIDDFIYTRMPF